MQNRENALSPDTRQRRDGFASIRSTNRNIEKDQTEAFPMELPDTVESDGEKL